MGDSEDEEIDERLGSLDSMTKREETGCAILIVILAVLAAVLVVLGLVVWLVR
jgi:hypothetical protein